MVSNTNNYKFPFVRLSSQNDKILNFFFFYASQLIFFCFLIKTKKLLGVLTYNHGIHHF